MGTDVRKISGKCCHVAVAALMPLILILAVETVARLSFTDALRWVTRVDSLNTLRFTYLWILLCILCAFAAINRLRWAAMIVFSLAMTLSLLHAGKLILLQQPLIPSDFVLFSMSASVWSTAYFPFTWIQVATFFLLAAAWLAACRWGLPDCRLTGRSRWVAGLAAAGAVALLAANVSLLASRNVPVYRKLTTVWSAEQNLETWQPVDPGIQNPDLSASFNYLGFGLIPGFLLNFDKAALDAEAMPPHYSAATVQQAWRNLPPEPASNTPHALPESERPHVVIILSESFWDPTWLDGVEIDPDPLPTFRTLAAGTNACAFISVSPIFGGFTCKAEYELLTGLSLAVLPHHVVPHTQHFNKHVPAIPAVFRANGYATIAIHAFLPEFWNRNLIYPVIGFDRFIHIGTMTHKEVRGKFISDNAVADEIIDTLAAADGPAFVFAITMQNHSPYGDHRYGVVEADSVTVTREGISADAVRDYVHGIRDADAMLGKLTRHFAASARPVLLLFVGDHQPSLVPPTTAPALFNQPIRADAGASTLVIGKKFTGPGLAWSSQGRPASLPSPVSLTALPSWVLRQARLPLPPFFRLSEHVFERFPVLHRGWGMTAAGEVFSLRFPFTDPLLLDYQTVCHDLLLGKNFSGSEMQKPETEVHLARPTP